MQDNNVNVNGGYKPHNYNVNDNGKYERARQVEFIADSLVDKFALTEESRPFMCKVAYKLSEARIWENYEKATAKGSMNPVGLFIWLCKRDGV